MSVFRDMRRMHNHYKVPRNTKVDFLDPEWMRFRINFLYEELNELESATAGKDLEEVIDALIDITVVAVGTLDLMGAEGQKHWDEVLQTNMDKEVVTDPDNSKRGFKHDLQKPKGWKGPEHGPIIKGIV